MTLRVTSENSYSETITWEGSNLGIANVGLRTGFRMELFLSSISYSHVFIRVFFFFQGMIKNLPTVVQQARSLIPLCELLNSTDDIIHLIVAFFVLKKVHIFTLLIIENKEMICNNVFSYRPVSMQSCFSEISSKQKGLEISSFLNF